MIPPSATPKGVLQPPTPVYSGGFGPAQAERLLWRAGFGPTPGQAEELSRYGLKGAVLALTRPPGKPLLSGPAPSDDGLPLQPYEVPGHDHLLWLDRMARTNQPLIERMALIWHDWFATSNQGVRSQALMIQQYKLFRFRALGSFAELFRDVTANPAMLVWLDGVVNKEDAPNENYAREMMELFSLGAGVDRGTYSQTVYSEADVREMARALTGWTATRAADTPWTGFRFDPARHDARGKRIFGRSGNYDWQDACRLCIEHPAHAAFLVPKLWSYFIATPPSSTDRLALQRLYRRSGYSVRPLVEAILLHPAFYEGPSMVKPPVVYVAGLMRALGRGVDSKRWMTFCELAGQRLFHPPNVSGWDDTMWLDTSRMRARWLAAAEALRTSLLDAEAAAAYDSAESAEQAVDAALEFCSRSAISPQTRGVLVRFADDAVAGMERLKAARYRGLRQNALRQLILACPDQQRC